MGRVRVYDVDVTPDWIVTVFAFEALLSTVYPVTDDAAPRERERLAHTSQLAVEIANTDTVSFPTSNPSVAPFEVRT